MIITVKKGIPEEEVKKLVHSFFHLLGMYHDF